MKRKAFESSRKKDLEIYGSVSCHLASVGLEMSWMKHVGFELPLTVEEFIVILSFFQL
jgi:hypothetical protein